ncbi:MAG: DUF3253 domain-containing protein [Solirubrobacteraceae bacterium]|nr:DUF3253 domain-containing protein [Solirubrobacteraceae bacterium]
MPHTDDDIRKTIDALLAQRDDGKTICPSEVARALEPDDWRPLMDQVRGVAVDEVRAGRLVITQGGEAVEPPFHGPIRLGRP